MCAIGWHQRSPGSWIPLPGSVTSSPARPRLPTVRDSKAKCVPTDREPDLCLDVSDLAVVYLCGTAPSTLVQAGHVRAQRPDAESLADALYRAERSPHCLHWF